MNNLEITKNPLIKTIPLPCGSLSGGMPPGFLPQRWASASFTKILQTRVKRPVRPGQGFTGTGYLIPGCCCTASSPCLPASSRTPTVTGSTGRQQSPMPGSSRLPHPGRALRRRTPVRPASAVSAGSCAPTLPSRWQRTSWRRRRRGRSVESKMSVLAAMMKGVWPWKSCCCRCNRPRWDAAPVSSTAAAHRRSPPFTALT